MFKVIKESLSFATFYLIIEGYRSWKSKLSWPTDTQFYTRQENRTWQTLNRPTSKRDLNFKLSPCSVCCVFFWVIPRRLNFICRRFRTLCLFHLYRLVEPAYTNETGRVFRNVGIYNSDAGELPRKNIRVSVIYFYENISRRNYSMDTPYGQKVRL